MAIFRRVKSSVGNNDDWDIASQLSDAEDMEGLSQDDVFRMLAGTEDDIEGDPSEDIW